MQLLFLANLMCDDESGWNLPGKGEWAPPKGSWSRQYCLPHTQYCLCICTWPPRWHQHRRESRVNGNCCWMGDWGLYQASEETGIGWRLLSQKSSMWWTGDKHGGENERLKERRRRRGQDCTYDTFISHFLCTCSYLFVFVSQCMMNVLRTRVM